LSGPNRRSLATTLALALAAALAALAGDLRAPPTQAP